MNVLLPGRVFDDIESAIKLNEQIQQAIDQLKKTKIKRRMKRFGQDVYLVDHKLWQTIQNKMENMTDIIMIMERYTLINVHKQNDQLIDEQKKLNLQLQHIDYDIELLSKTNIEQQMMVERESKNDYAALIKYDKPMLEDLARQFRNLVIASQSNFNEIKDKLTKKKQIHENEINEIQDLENMRLLNDNKVKQLIEFFLKNKSSHILPNLKLLLLQWQNNHEIKIKKLLLSYQALEIQNNEQKQKIKDIYLNTNLLREDTQKLNKNLHLIVDKINDNMNATLTLKQQVNS